MNLHQLRIFYEVARAQSFSAAGEKLQLTQPAVTWQIKKLEDYYELQFFERTGKKIFLTEEGRTLLEFADPILNLSREAEEALADLKGLSRGTLRIDTVFTFGDYYLPSLLQGFHGKYPRIVFQVNTGNTSQIIENTLAHKNDISFVAYDPQNAKLRVQEIITDVLVGVVAPNHPFARKKSIRLRDLNGQPLILREKGSSPRRILDEIFQQRRISPQIVLESASTPAIKKTVEQGMGIAILSQQVIKEELQSNRLTKLTIRDAEIVYRFYLIHHKDKYLSRILKAFMEMAVDPAKRS